MDLFRPSHKKIAGDDFSPIPVGEAQETDWAEWEDSLAFDERQPTPFQNTEKMPLPTPDPSDQDAFGSVTRNRG